MKKNATKLMALLAIGAAAMTVFGSCATTKKARQNRTVLSWKGSEWNPDTSSIPKWVQETSGGQGNTRIMEFPEYKGQYCFVGRATSPNREFAETWARNFNVQQQLSQYFQTSVANLMVARETGSNESTGAGQASRTVENNAASESAMKSKIMDALSTASNANFSGARQEADFWSYIRTYDPDVKGKYSDEYEAYVLYLIPKDAAQKQMEVYAKAVATKMPELSSIATGLVTDLSANNFDLVKAFDTANGESR